MAPDDYSPGMRIRSTIALAIAAFSTPPLTAQEPKPPSRSDTLKLVREYLALDGRSAEGHARQGEILERIDLLPPLKPREVRDWRKRLLREQAKGRKLEKSGRNWFWDDQKRRIRRGLYLVGGETRRPKALLIGMHGGGVGSGTAVAGLKKKS